MLWGKNVWTELLQKQMFTYKMFERNSEDRKWVNRKIIEHKYLNSSISAKIMLKNYL